MTLFLYSLKSVFNYEKNQLKFGILGDFLIFLNFEIQKKKFNKNNNILSIYVDEKSINYCIQEKKLMRGSRYICLMSEF